MVSDVAGEPSLHVQALCMRRRNYESVTGLEVLVGTRTFPGRT